MPNLNAAANNNNAPLLYPITEAAPTAVSVEHAQPPSPVVVPTGGALASMCDRLAWRRMSGGGSMQQQQQPRPSVFTQFQQPSDGDDPQSTGGGLLAPMAPSPDSFAYYTDLVDSTNCIECISLLPKLTFGFIYLLLVMVAFVGNVYLVRELAQLLRRQRRARQGSADANDPSAAAAMPNASTVNINCIVLATALCDLGYVLTSAPDLAAHVYDIGWIVPTLWSCAALRYGQQLFMNSSILLQLLSSFERYAAAKSANQHCSWPPLAPWHVSLLIFTMTSTAAMTSVPYAVFQQTVDDRNLKRCSWSQLFVDSHYLWYRTAEYLLYYVTPLLLMFAMMTHIAAIVWIFKCQPVIIVRNGRSEVTDGDQELSRLRQNCLVVIVARLVVVSCCHTPAQPAAFAVRFLSEYVAMLRAIPGWLNYVMNACVLLNCVANPVVYAKCCRRFSEAPKLRINVIPPGSNTTTLTRQEANGLSSQQRSYEYDDTESVTYVAAAVDFHLDDITPTTPPTPNNNGGFMPMKCSPIGVGTDSLPSPRLSTPSLQAETRMMTATGGGLMQVPTVQLQRVASTSSSNPLNKLFSGRKKKTSQSSMLGPQPVNLLSVKSSPGFQPPKERRERKTMASIIAETKQLQKDHDLALNNNNNNGAAGAGGNGTVTIDGQGSLNNSRRSSSCLMTPRPNSRSSRRHHMTDRQASDAESYLSLEIEDISVSESNLE